MAIVLSKRTAILGPSYNGRTELHGDDKVDASDWKVNSFSATQEEIDKVVGIEGFAARLFVSSKGQAPENVFHHFEPLKFTEKFKGCKVTLWIGTADEIELTNCNVGKIVLIGLTGGRIDLAFSFSAQPENKEFNLMRTGKGGPVEVRVQLGKMIESSKETAQPELDLDAPPGQGTLEKLTETTAETASAPKAKRVRKSRAKPKADAS